MINVGIVGAGYIGEIHINAINKLGDTRIAGVVDIVEEKGKSIAEKYNTAFYKDIKSLIKGENNLDAIAVCVPTCFHKEAVLEIAEAGINIFCEKPISLAIKDADDMIEAVKRNKVKAMAGHVLRFWPEYMKAKNIIEAGHIGKPLQVFCQRVLRTPSRSKYYLSEKFCGGAAIDLQIHELDYLIYLFEVPLEVESYGIYDENFGGWIHMNTNVRFKNDTYGVVDAGWSARGAYPFSVILRVLGEAGTIEWGFKAGRNLGDMDGSTPLRVYSMDGTIKEYKIGKEDAYKQEWDYFLNCIKFNKKVDNSTFKDGRKALSLALSTIESAKKHINHNH